MNDTIFLKKIIEHKIFVLIFSTNLFEIFLILMKLEFSRRILENYSDI